MPYFLRAGDGSSGDYVSLASDISFASSDTFVIEADIQLASSERGRVWGDSAGFQNRLLVDARTSPATANLRLTTGSVSWTLDAGIDPTDRHTYNVERFANDDIVLKVDGVAQGTTQNLGGTGRIQWLFTSNSSSQVRAGIDLYYLSVSKNGALTNYYDPSATGGTGSILEDTTGSNDGALNNFPTDDSQWVFYSAGGAITVTGATPTYSYASVRGSVDLTGEIVVTGATPTYSYTAVAGDVDLTAEIQITGQTPNYSYAAISADVSLDAGIVVTGQTPSYSYNAVSGSIVLQGVISVTGQTPSYTYSAISANVSLFDGEVAVFFEGSVKALDAQGDYKDDNFTGSYKVVEFTGNEASNNF